MVYNFFYYKLAPVHGIQIWCHMNKLSSAQIEYNQFCLKKRCATQKNIEFTVVKTNPIASNLF